MSNLDFLKHINAKIYKYNSLYYVMIPFVNYDSSQSYIQNYDNFIYIKISNDLLKNDDLEWFIAAKDNTYEIEFDIDAEEKNIKDYEYCAIINDGVFVNFTEEQIKNTNQTFAQIIKDHAFVSDISVKTKIYQNIIDFYANGQTDNVLAMLNLMLNSKAYSYTLNGVTTTCGCNSIINGNSTTGNQSSNPDGTINLSCPDIYLNSILLYLPQMFGDIDFYCNFFSTEENEPNEDMIDKLICLLEQILKLLNNGNNPYSSESSKTHCMCAELDTSINLSIYNIISNYIKVLNWVKNCKIEENENKIKIYGTQFGEIFPNLYFI